MGSIAIYLFPFFYFLAFLTPIYGFQCPIVPTLAWQAPWSSINSTTTGAGDNKYGFEDGVVVRRNDGSFVMIAAEMYGDPKWVAMRLGVWSSTDGTGPWVRQRTLRLSTANYDGSDPHSSSWGPFLLFDPLNSSWAVSYVGYRGAPSNSSGWLGNFQGTIFARYAPMSGDAGLDSDFFDATYRDTDSVLLAPDAFNVNGPWPFPCQGLQGTDSFYPFRVNESLWAAFVGTSHEETPDPWSGGKWPVSLAVAPAMSGPWERYNPGGGPAAAAPCVDINGGYSENPVVSAAPQGSGASFHAVLDFLGRESSGFGYTCSQDGLNWSTAAMVATPTGCRTPFGLIPLTPAEGSRMRSSILAFGAINATQLDAPNSSLAWSFYTVTEGSYEVFQAAITYLAW